MTDRTCRRATALLMTASTLALASPAGAVDVLFSTHRDAGAQVGQRISQADGLTQLRLDNGAVVSFVEGADYRINTDDTVDLYRGSVTVAGGPQGVTVVRMPDGVEGRVGGQGSAANFSVAGDGSSRGHVMSGSVDVVRGGNARTFAGGEMWQAAGQGGLRRVVSNGQQATPEGGVADMGDGGPVAAAQNGVPVSLGDALAAAGASGDIIAAARRVEAAAGNPALDTFPSGDLALLVGYAARFTHLNGGTPFPSASVDIIRTYLGYLAGGGSGASFLTTYAGFLTQYLDLIRAGALPSNFNAASLADINAFIAYSGWTSGFASLSASNRTLVEAYLAFLQGGGNPDLFAGRYTDLVNAYFAFVRAGGDPAAFTGATQSTLDAYIAFLSDSGLLAQLSAQNRALLQAYLSNGGFAFTGQYQAALDAYFAYLAAGHLPSDYTAVDPAALRQYLETLKATGLFDQVLGANAQFFAGYLAYLQQGGAIDGYAGLNANVFAGYASQLADFYAFIQGGGLPNGYSGNVDELFQYLAALEQAGALDDFLGASAGFFGDYLAFVQGGGDASLFAQLPGLNLDSFAAALNAYAAFIAGGGLPSGYTAADLQDLADYIDILQHSGRIDALLGSNASLLSAYFAYLAGGGSTDGFSGLPIYGDYVAALNAYYAFLAGGGLPADYTGLTQAQVKAYLDALAAAGGLGAYGSLQGFFTDYYAYLAGGGAASGYASLPLYQDYLAALQAYYDYLLAGGLPSAYTALTKAQIEAYLALLDQYGVLQAELSGTYLQFLVDYLAFLGGGGDPDMFAGLPTSGGGSGGGGGTPGAPTPLAGYSGGFNAATANVNMIVAGGLNGGGAFAGGESGFQTSTYSLNGSGGLTSYNRGGSVTRTNGSATVGDIYGNADVLIGRWYSGTNTGANPFTMNANQGLHYMLARPLEAALPASGRIDYYLVASTPATIADGSYAPGTFEAEMAILFGSQNKLAMEGTITMPTGGADYVYSFATEGGMADAESSTNTISTFGNGAFSTYIAGATDNAGRCTAPDSCGLGVFGSFAKDEDTIGMTYEAYSGASGKAIVGAAIFAAGPDRTGAGSGGTGSGGGGTGGESAGTTVSNQAVVYSGKDVGLDSRPGADVTYDDAGLPIAYVVTFNDFTRENERPTLGSATVLDGGHVGDVIAWGRWADGTTGGRYFADQDGFDLGPNDGFHIVSGDPATNLPASGTVDYELAGWTKPTAHDGSMTPGTFDGTMAVTFGATPTASFDFAVGIDGGSYGFGAQDRAIAGDMMFFANDMAVSGSGTACPTGACMAQMRGFLAGDGASGVGVSYNFAESGSTQRIYGAAAFATSAAIAASGGSATSAGSNPYLGVVPAADVNMASVQASAWGRWTGSATTAAVATLDMPTLQREAAAGLAGIDIDGIEQRLGKFVTFSRP